MTKKLVDVLEDTTKNIEAKIFHEDGNGFSISYYIDGNMVKSEVFPDKSKYYVEDAATNWLKGIRVLNG